MLDADAETSDEIVLTVRRQWAKQPQMPGDAPVGIFDSDLGRFGRQGRGNSMWCSHPNEGETPYLTLCQTLVADHQPP